MERKRELGKEAREKYLSGAGYSEGLSNLDKPLFNPIPKTERPTPTPPEPIPAPIPAPTAAPKPTPTQPTPKPEPVAPRQEEKLQGGYRDGGLSKGRLRKRGWEKISHPLKPRPKRSTRRLGAQSAPNQKTRTQSATNRTSPIPPHEGRSGTIAPSFI